MRDRLLAAYVRTPEHPAKFRIVSWLGRHVFPEMGIRAHAHPDLELCLHPRDWIEYLLLRGDRYESLTLDFLTANLKHGDAAVLAGVNFGQHVAVAARAVGTAGMVVGVEPQPAAMVRARDNLRLNHLDAQVKLVNVALGSREEFLPMAWSSASNAGAASLLDSGPGFFVRVVSVSQLIEAFCPRAPRLMLLDVQGHEAQVLAGLTEHRLPEILIVEFAPEFMAKSGVSPEELRQSMVRFGYQLRTLHGTAVTDVADVPEFNVVGVLRGAEVSWV
jgi:FkbM family methyltransferase